MDSAELNGVTAEWRDEAWRATLTLPPGWQQPRLSPDGARVAALEPLPRNPYPGDTRDAPARAIGLWVLATP